MEMPWWGIILTGACCTLFVLAVLIAVVVFTLTRKPPTAHDDQEGTRDT
jgi:hypothetical protein